MFLVNAPFGWSAWFPLQREGRKTRGLQEKVGLLWLMNYKVVQTERKPGLWLRVCAHFLEVVKSTEGTDMMEPEITESCGYFESRRLLQ